MPCGAWRRMNCCTQARLASSLVEASKILAHVVGLAERVEVFEELVGADVVSAEVEVLVLRTVST
jgi:hypothetical protein